MPKILVVEKEDAVRATVCRILRGVGYDVYEADDGREGIVCLLDERNFDILITDWKMRQVSGSRMVGEVAALEVSLPPVIAMTGGDLQKCQEEFVARLPRGHYFVCISKPFDREILLAEANKALSQVS